MPIIEQLLYQRCYIKKAVRKNFAIFTGNHLCWSLFWDQVEIKLKAVRPATSCKACNIIKKGLQHRYFPVNIAKFLITPVLKNICVRLLLKIIIKKDLLEKPTGHNDHYNINMGGQRPKTGSNWPLTGPYLERCKKAKCLENP